MTSKEDRLRKVEAQLLGFATWVARRDPDQDQFNAVAHEYTMAIDAEYAEEIGRLRQALEPFAAAASIERRYTSTVSAELRAICEDDDYHCAALFTNGQVRQAALALSTVPPEPSGAGEP